MIDQEDIKNAIPDIKDEDDKQQVEDQLTSAKREIKAFEEAAQAKKEGKVRYEGQVERQKQIRKLQLDNFRKIKPVFEYEKLDEYWVLQKEELADKVLEEEQVAKGTVKRFDLEIEAIEQNIKANQEKIKRLSDLLGDEE